MEIVPLKAFKDNYVWTLRNETHAAVVDPGEARPVLGGIYVIRAVKRVPGMRLVTPAWRMERARRRSLAPVSQRSHKNHHGG